jgi:hypothetical protein
MNPNIHRLSCGIEGNFFQVPFQGLGQDRLQLGGCALLGGQIVDGGAGGKKTQEKEKQGRNPGLPREWIGGHILTLLD